VESFKAHADALSHFRALQDAGFKEAV